MTYVVKDIYNPATNMLRFVLGPLKRDTWLRSPRRSCLLLPY